MSDDIGLLVTVGSFGRIGIEAVQGKKRLSPFSPQLPTSLRQLTKNAYSYESTESAFVRYMLLHDFEKTPIYVDIKGKRTQVSWNSRLTGEGKTFFERKESTVALKRVISNSTGYTDAFIRLGKRLLLDLSTEQMGYVNDLEGWEPWYDLYGQLAELENTGNRRKAASLPAFDDLSVPLEVSYEMFNRYQAENQGTQEHLVMTKVDEPDVENAVTSELGYRLKVSHDQWDNKVTVSVSGVLENHQIGLDKSLYSAFEACQRKINHVQRKRFSVLVGHPIEEAIFQKDVDIQAQMTPVLDDMYPDLSTWLTDLRLAIAPIVGTTETKLFLQDQFCAQYQLQFENEARILSTILFYLADMNWEYNTSLNVSLPMDEFLQRLEVMTPRLSDLGVTVIWEDYPVELRQLDVKMTVHQHKDWFTLHPEIMSTSGETFDLSRLTPFADQKGVYRDGDKLIVIASKSQAMVDHLKQYLPDETTKGRDIVKLSRLQVLDLIMLRQLGAELELPDSVNYLLELASEKQSLPKRDMPKGFQGTLRHYQQEGYEWMAYLYEFGFGGCLADDMGLGKTVQTLVFLASVRQRMLKSSFIKTSKKPFLIVVPPSLKFVWMSEVDKFFPELTYCDFSDPEVRDSYQNYDLLFITYDMIRREVKWFSRKYFEVGVFDEAQLVKNIYTGRAAAARKLKVGFKLCLTGTPIENHLGEYYSILDLAVPGLLESYDQFQKYVKKQQEHQDYERLIRRTSPFVLRRVKEAILDELPEKTEQDILLDMSDTQKNLYKKIVSQLKKDVKAAYDQKPAQQAHMTALTAILRLRQLCVAPSLVEPEFKERSPKVSYLVDRLHELKHEGHCALVFSQFRQFLDVIENVMKEENLPYIRMDGKTPVHKRKALVDSFQETEKPLFFLISLKTGGVGLNLTRASYVFHLDPWWNPSVEDQASDRVYRIGQTQSVFINKLIMRHSVEEKIVLLKGEKKSLFTDLMDKGVAMRGAKALSKTDFDFLIS